MGVVKKSLLAAVALIAVSGGAHSLLTDSLAESFQTPPDSARAHTWWHWMNGHVSAEGITKDLEAMKKAGLGGFQAFHITAAIPDGPVKYDSEEWHALMAHTVREADRLGLEMCFHNCAGWSSSGGPWITPEHSMLEVVWTETQVSGGGELEIMIEQPEARHGYYRDIAVLAFPTPAGEQKGEEGFRIKSWKSKSGGGYKTRQQYDTREVGKGDIILNDQVVDLTGRLVWNPPAGRYTVVRFGYTTTGKTNHPSPREGVGLECDKLSRAGTDLHWNEIVKRVLDDAGPLAGRVLNNVLIDSYEARHQNWTHDFAEQFRKRRGYDMLPWMPCMTGRVVGSLECSERFLWDMRCTIADLMDENYFGRFAELCRENGLLLSIEPYGDGGFDRFRTALAADIPMGEWWVEERKAWHDWSAKLASSAAHIGGKRHVGAEAFTAGRKSAAWITHPYSMKARGDFNYTRGINRYIFHTFVHQPWADDVLPGMTMGPFGMQMNRNNTWFLHARPWFDYLARCQHMLQEGQFVADLLYIYGENAPDRVDQLAEMSPVPPTGYDFDMSGVETLMDLSVENGRLVLPSGMGYSVLVLTRMHHARPEVLEKVAELVAQGAVVVGEKPVASPSLENHPACDERVKELAESLWNTGRVHDPKQLAAVLEKLDLPPDFETPGQDGVAYIHRRVDGKEVYFVASRKEAPCTVRCRFRVGGRMPELWHPDTGRIEPVPVWSPCDGRTEVVLDLDPAGSVFVVFDHPSEQADPVAEVATVDDPLPVSGPWTVSFGKMGPEHPVEFKSLIPWNEHADEEIKCYSGAATYCTEFDYPASRIPHPVSLDLGQVEVMARVRLNGRDLGLLWKPPFRVEVSDAIRSGKNTLEVTVVNLWINRLIGDEQYPDLFKRVESGGNKDRGPVEIPGWLQEGGPRPETERKAVSVWRHWEKDVPLVPSGLLGPVRLLQ